MANERAATYTDLMSHLSLSGSSSSSSSLGDEMEVTVQPVGGVEPKYECPICLGLLHQPRQTECGHRFCLGCLRKWRQGTSGNLICPVCNTQLSDYQIYPDNFARREISGLEVYCSNQSHGCDETFQYSQLQEHLASCPYSHVKCASCGSSMARNELTKHQESSCPRRQVPCPHCGVTIIFQDLKLHMSSICPQSLVPCDDCQEEFAREKLSSHQEVCPKVKVPCNFQDFGCATKVERGELESHLYLELRSHLNLVTQALRVLCGTLRVPLPLLPVLDSGVQIGNFPSTTLAASLAALTSGFASDFSHQEQSNPLNPTGYNNSISYCSLPQGHENASSGGQTAELSSMGSFVGSWEGGPMPAMASMPSGAAQQEQENKHLRQEMASLRCTVKELESQVEEESRHSQHLLCQLKDYEAQMANGLMVFRIHDYWRRKNEAIRGEAVAIHSPGFYTSFYGYYLCVRFNPNGVDAAFGTHVSLFVHFMQGKNDDILSWPFRGKITLTILDQQNKECPQHISETLVAQPHLAAFQKPSSNRNVKGFGYMEFAPIMLIENPTFLKNDCLIVRVKVDENLF